MGKRLSKKRLCLKEIRRWKKRLKCSETAGCCADALLNVEERAHYIDMDKTVNLSACPGRLTLNEQAEQLISAPMLHAALNHPDHPFNLGRRRYPAYLTFLPSWVAG
jgi:hypothetical protein